MPTPGFYGLYDPVLQTYSCRGSVYWLAKAFLPLMLTESDSRYWTDKENEGPWAEMKKGEVYNRWAPAPQILVTNYPDIEASEVRAICLDVPRYYATEAYSRLAYNTEFPWQADGKNGEVTMAYIFKNARGQWEPMRRYKVGGFDGGTLCRTARPVNGEEVVIDLLDTPLPNGTLRRDRVTKTNGATTVRLGHYALPERPGTPIRERTIKLKGGRTAYLINNGTHELAFIALDGWDKVEVVRTTGLHPETERSATIDAQAVLTAPRDLSSLLLFKRGTFKAGELNKTLATALIKK